MHLWEGTSLTAGCAALGSSPWTLQTRGCGERGDRINLPIGFLDFNQTSGNSLTAKGGFL